MAATFLIVYFPFSSGCMDEGGVFVGNLNPLYELEIHRGTQIWDKLLARNHISGIGKLGF